MDVYYTQKWIRLRDRRLAALYWLGLSAVAVAVVVQVGLEKAYLEYDDESIGIVRPRLKRPALLNFSSAADYAYCHEERKGMEDNCVIW